MKKLVIASRNKGKVKEMEESLKGLPYELVGLDSYPDVPDVEETGSNFYENAALKSAAYCLYTGELTLADDSGLEIDALNGAPGVFSARFAPSDPERIAKVLELMREVPYERRTARFRCVIAFADVRDPMQTTTGTVEGMILPEPRGEGGFGYDPIFYIPQLHKTMAQLTSEEKNAISHRGKALKDAKGLLLELHKQSGTAQSITSSY